MYDVQRVHLMEVLSHETCNFYVKEAESKVARAWQQTILNLVGGSIQNIDPAL